MRDWLQTLHDELAAGRGPCVRVVVATVRGSAPREAGACMLVSGAGEFGSVGGGHLEHVATRVARELLASIDASPRLDRFPLAASLGQCCGGIVELWFQRYDARDLELLALGLRERGVMAGSRLLTLDAAIAEGATALLDRGTSAVLLRRPAGPVLYERLALDTTDLWLFGAGHVARALVNVLGALPFRITWIDSRDGMLPENLAANIRGRHSPQPAEEVAEDRKSVV